MYSVSYQPDTEYLISVLVLKETKFMILTEAKYQDLLPIIDRIIWLNQIMNNFSSQNDLHLEMICLPLRKFLPIWDISSLDGSLKELNINFAKRKWNHQSTKKLISSTSRPQ